MSQRSRFGYLPEIEDPDASTLTGLGDIEDDADAAQVVATAALDSANTSIAAAQNVAVDASTTLTAANDVLATATNASATADIPGATAALAGAQALLTSATNAENDIATADGVLAPLAGEIGTINTNVNTAKSNATTATSTASTATSTAATATSTAATATTENQRVRDFLFATPNSRTVTKADGSTSSSLSQILYTTVDSNGITANGTSVVLPEGKLYCINYAIYGRVDPNGNFDPELTRVQLYMIDASASVVSNIYKSYSDYSQEVTDGAIRNVQLQWTYDTTGLSSTQRTLRMAIVLVGPSAGVFDFINTTEGFFTIYEM